jgi:hypothetical protein
MIATALLCVTIAMTLITLATFSEDATGPCLALWVITLAAYTFQPPTKSFHEHKVAGCNQTTDVKVALEAAP